MVKGIKLKISFYDPFKKSPLSFNPCYCPHDLSYMHYKLAAIKKLGPPWYGSYWTMFVFSTSQTCPVLLLTIEKRSFKPTTALRIFAKTRFEEHQHFFSSEIWVIRTQVIAATGSRIRWNLHYLVVVPENGISVVVLCGVKP